MNPQFHIQIPRTSSNKCHVVVSVTQFYETVPDSRKKKPLFAIGFAVYEVPHATARLTPHFVAEQVLNLQLNSSHALPTLLLRCVRYTK
jgi:hypothetical protein